MRNWRKLTPFSLLIVMGTTFVSASLAQAATITWTGAKINCQDTNSCGDDTTWDDPRNWSPERVPTVGDTVNIGTDANGNAPDILLENPNTFSNDPRVVTVLNWTRGTIRGTLSVTGTLNISGDNDKTLADPESSLDVNAALNNLGSATWSGNGKLFLEGRADLNNPTGRSFTISNNATLDGFNFSGSPAFNNAGTITKTSSGITTIQNVNFIHTGTADIQTGVFRLGDSIFDEGHQIAANATLTGAGRTLIGGNFTTLAGTVNIGATHHFEVGFGGLLIGTGTFSNGFVDWTGGEMQGTFTIPAATKLNISGANPKTLSDPDESADINGAINNLGTATWSGSGAINLVDSVNFKNSGTLTLQSDATLHGDDFGAEGPPSFHNSGTITKTTTSGFTTFETIDFNHTGTLDIQTGTFRLRDSSSEAGHSFAANSVLKGVGRTLLVGNFLTVNGLIDLRPEHKLEVGTFVAGEVGGLLKGTATFKAGTLAWTGGTLQGNFTVPTGTFFAISGADQKNFNDPDESEDVNGFLNNAGTGTWSGTGIIRLDGTTTFNNSGTFTISNDSTLDGRFGLGDNTWNNTGTITKSSTGTTTVEDVDFNNTGTANINAGVFRLSNADTAGHFFANGSTITGAGRTRLTGNFLTLGGTVNIGATHTFEVGTFVAGAVGGVLQGTGILNGGTVAWSGGTFEGNFTIPTGTKFNISGADPKTLLDPDQSADVNGVLNNAGTATWSGTGEIVYQGTNAFNNSGTFTVQNAAAMSGDFSANEFNNSGTFTKTSTGSTTFVGVDFNNSKIADIQSGILELATPSTGHSFANTSTLTGAGRTRLTGNFLVVNGTTTIGATHTFEIAQGINDTGVVTGTGTLSGGTVNWTGGTIRSAGLTVNANNFLINGANVKTLEDTDTQAGLLINAGTANWSGGAIQSNATFRNSGTLNIGGVGTTASVLFEGGESRFEQTATGTLGIDLGGTTPGSGFDVLTVGNEFAGEAALAGKLKVAFKTGYTPGATDTFKILNYASKTGQFATVELPLGASLQPQYNATNVTLRPAVRVALSGTVSTFNGAGTRSGLADVTVTLSGAGTGTTTTAANGNYSFTNLLAGVYTVSVAKAGVTFEQATQTVTVGETNVTNINFQTKRVSLSGTVSNFDNTGLGGVTVTLSGTQTGTTTTTANGAYSFANLIAGSYTVSVAKSGVTFEQATKTVTVGTTNVADVNFKAVQPPSRFSVSGNVFTTNANGNRVGLAGATLTLSGAATGTTTSAADGSYSFANLLAGDYTISVAKTGVNFDQVSQAVKVVALNVQNVNFNAVVPPAKFSVSGRVRRFGDTGEIIGVSDATVTLTGPTSVVTTLTGDDGRFTIPKVESGTYTVTVAKNDIEFDPSSRSVTVSNQDVSNVSFKTYLIRGGIVNGKGTPVAGVTVTVVGANITKSMVTGADGKYKFSGLGKGTFIVRPSQVGFVFTPTRAVINLPTFGKLNLSPNGKARFVRKVAPPSGAPSSSAKKF